MKAAVGTIQTFNKSSSDQRMPAIRQIMNQYIILHRVALIQLIEHELILIEKKQPHFIHQLASSDGISICLF